MEKSFESKKQKEREPEPRDITKEFESMDPMDFLDFLRTVRKEPVLSIVTDWNGVWPARRLKAFLESMEPGQKKMAAIRATRKQYEEELNVFASGVKWIEVQESD